MRRHLEKNFQKDPLKQMRECEECMYLSSYYRVAVTWKRKIAIFCNSKGQN